jgi:hypothetical protein
MIARKYKQIYDGYVSTYHYGVMSFDNKRDRWIPNGDKVEFYNKMLLNIEYQFLIKIKEYNLKPSATIERKVNLSEKYHTLKFNQRYKTAIESFSNVFIKEDKIIVHDRYILNENVNMRDLTMKILQDTNQWLIYIYIRNLKFRKKEDLDKFRNDHMSQSIQFNYECMLSGWERFKMTLSKFLIT